MKAILISIKPRFVAKILNGEKTVEVRKSMSKCDLPIDVYIYCTKSNYLGFISKRYAGKVVAKFTLNKVEEIEFYSYLPDDWDYDYETDDLCGTDLLKQSCLIKEELSMYLKGKVGYAWHIDNLVIFDKPKELSEFKVKGFERIKVMGSPYGDLLGSVAYHYEKKPILKPLTKAPQSWCYCEGE